MQAEAGWVCAGFEPPGWYSTSTPFILLPGTFGRVRSKTNVTLAVSVFIRTVGKSLAEAPLTKRAARATPQRNLVNIVFASLRQMRRYKSTVKRLRVFQSKIARGVNRGFAIISCYPMGRSSTTILSPPVANPVDFESSRGFTHLGTRTLPQ